MRSHLVRRFAVAVGVAAFAVVFLSVSAVPASATTQNGVRYGVNPDYQPPDAGEVAVKTNQVTLITPAVSQLLNLNQGNPVPPPNTVSQSDGACENGCGRCSVSCSPPSALKNSVSGQRQQQTNWCVPASVATLFTSYSMCCITQATLASEMKTNSSGTFFSNAPPALNKRQNYNYYWNDAVASGADILQRVTLDVWNYGSDAILPGQGSWLPWWYQNNYSGLHAFVLYGYYTQSGGGFYTWDPLNQTWAGFHTLNKEDAYYINNDAATSQNATPSLVW
jgi:hypothetical protein